MTCPRATPGPRPPTHAEGFKHHFPRRSLSASCVSGTLGCHEFHTSTAFGQSLRKGRFPHFMADKTEALGVNDFPLSPTAGKR